ncbi:MAG: S24 family peptidase, partial [Saprospiraceae bacterium]|nr:S24 family peptidase [Saprospiraceae bacterium]
FTGDGPMFMMDEKNEDFHTLTVVVTHTDEARIVHVPMPAQAGYAAEHANPTFIRELPSFVLPDYKYNVGTHRSFDVGGDSMEPTLFEGDKIVCSYLEPTLWEGGIKDNYVYVIVTRGDVVVKRVFNRIRTGRCLELHSDNDFYQPFNVPIGDVREIWYVRAKISPFLPSPANIQSKLRSEVQELTSLIQQQSKLIENLYQTIEKLAAK